MDMGMSMGMNTHMRRISRVCLKSNNITLNNLAKCAFNKRFIVVLQIFFPTLFSILYKTINKIIFLIMFN
jgi:hypothetical protein